MVNLIMEMEKYRRENMTLTEADIQTINRVTSEMNVVLKHSSDRVTFDKNDLVAYVNLMAQYNRMEGFNTAINFVDAYYRETNETKENKE